MWIFRWFLSSFSKMGQFISGRNLLPGCHIPQPITKSKQKPCTRRVTPRSRSKSYVFWPFKRITYILQIETRWMKVCTNTSFLQKTLVLNVTNSTNLDTFQKEIWVDVCGSFQHDVEGLDFWSNFQENLFPQFLAPFQDFWMFCSHFH